jgi:hypothetical protein
MTAPTTAEIKIIGEIDSHFHGRREERSDGDFPKERGRRKPKLP